MCLATCSCLKLSHHFNILQPLKYVNTIHLHSVYASVQWGKKVLNCIEHELKMVTIVYYLHVKGALFQIIFHILTLSNPIFLPTAYSPALIYLSLPFSYNHGCANTTHNHLFTSKHTACREIERVQPALPVGQSPYYMGKSVGQALTADRAQQNRVGRLPTLERNRKIIMSDEV